MLQLIKIIKKYRIHMGFTQSDLAHAARISLPSLQNLESGKSKNPSLETLIPIFSVLGLTLEIQHKPANWDLLALCGAPLSSSQHSRIRPTPDLLLNSLRLACSELELKKVTTHQNSRELLATQALLLALATYFPHFFRKNCHKSTLLMQFYPKTPTGPMIKLKRQTAAILATYL
jgi:transcriptional regulator with XRE-family HTH domain